MPVPPASRRRRIETEQGTVAKRPKERQGRLPLWLQQQIAGQDGEKRGIVPLESNALALRYALLKPEPDFALLRPEHRQAELLDPPSVVERRLRAAVGERVAGQAVEDEGGLPAGRGPALYHRYNAVLKRVLGNKSRAAMTLPELEAAIAWLGRNRLADHQHLVEGDPRYAWTARQRRGAWVPPVGRDKRNRQAAGRRP